MNLRYNGDFRELQRQRQRQLLSDLAEGESINSAELDLINEGIDKNGNFGSHHAEYIGIQPQNQQQALNIVNIPAPNVPQQIAPLQQAPIVAAQVQNHQSRHQRAVNQKPQGFYTGM